MTSASWNSKRALRLAYCVFVCVALHAKVFASPATELALPSGTTLIARTSTGDIKIHAGKNFERTYEWGGCALDADMRRRESRWLGSLGIYDPAGGFGFLSAIFPWWYKCKGISRTVVQEGQLHFASKSEAELWIGRYSSSSSTVWSNDGLIVQWATDPQREQINVDLWQVCIGGEGRLN